MARVKDSWSSDMANKYSDHPEIPPALRVQLALDAGFHDPDFTEAEAAAAANMSPRRLRYLLAAEDTTYREQVLERRMNRGEELLAGSNYLIANIARLSGYRCASTFTQRFKERHSGLTPRQFRVAKGKSARAGGVTGAARSPGARNRAREEGRPEPPMHRTAYGTPGESEVFDADTKSAIRQAEAFERVSRRGGASIAQMVELRSQKRRRGRPDG